MEKIDVLRDAQDIVLLSQPDKDRDSYVYASKPSLEVQRQLYDISISNPADADIEAFQRYWEFDEEEGIKGSSIPLGLRFDKMALRPSDLWLPTYDEARELEKRGKLENGVYRDYGVAVYNNGSPNGQIAQTLVSQAEKLGLQLPLIVPFKSLDYVLSQNKELEVKFLGSKWIITGREAQARIDFLTYKGNSGVQGLFRDGNGYWDASWDYLGNSDDDGRVDWVCGEATKKILKNAYSESSERKYGREIKEIRERQKTDKENFRKLLK